MGTRWWLYLEFIMELLVEQENTRGVKDTIYWFALSFNLRMQAVGKVDDRN